jgi:hypothetical protein
LRSVSGLPRSPLLKGSARDGVSSCLDSRILRHIRLLSLRLPRSPGHPVAPPDASASCPAFCIFGFCRRWSLGLPRVSHPIGATQGEAPGCPFASLLQSRLPMSPRVAPVPASSGVAGDGASSCPESRILQRFRRRSLGLPLSFALPVAPADESPGCPGSCIFRLCRRRIPGLPRVSRPSAPPALKPQVAPRLRSPVAPPGVVASFPAPRTFRLCLGFESSGCPAFSLPRRRLMVSRVSSVPAPSGFAVPASSGCPESCIYGWVDDDSRFSSNFASSARLRMNLRVQSGFAHSRLTLDAFSQFPSGLPPPASRL